MNVLKGGSVLGGRLEKGISDARKEYNLNIPKTLLLRIGLSLT